MRIGIKAKTGNPDHVLCDVTLTLERLGKLKFLSEGHFYRLPARGEHLSLLEAQDIRDYVVCFRIGKNEVRHIIVIGAEKHGQRKCSRRCHVSDALEAGRTILVDRQSLTPIGK